MKKKLYSEVQLLVVYDSSFSSVQSLRYVRLFSLSIIDIQNLLKLMPIKLVIMSNHLILCRPFSSCLQSFPMTFSQWSFPMTQFFTSGGQSIWVSGSALILRTIIQDWFPLGLTGFISLQSKGLSRVFSNTIVQKHQCFVSQLSFWSNSHIHTWLLEKQ